jgi:prevent-host-death family protein
MARRTVGTRELKTRLGRYIDQVRRGATLVVTQRGEPVAELRPIEKPADEPSRLAELRAAGVVTRRSSAGLAKFRPIRIAGPGLSRAVVEGRAERF